MSIRTRLTKLSKVLDHRRPRLPAESVLDWIDRYTLEIETSQLSTELAAGLEQMDRMCPGIGEAIVAAVHREICDGKQERNVWGTAGT